jgi:hypothetical protein
VIWGSLLLTKAAAGMEEWTGIKGTDSILGLSFLICITKGSGQTLGLGSGGPWIEGLYVVGSVVQ